MRIAQPQFFVQWYNSANPQSKKKIHTIGGCQPPSPQTIFDNRELHDRMKETIPALATRPRIPVMSLFWAAAALPGLIALGWLLRVPSEAEAAVFLGFSLLRLLLAGAVLVMVLVFAGLAALAATRPPVWQRAERLTKRFISAPTRAYALLTVLFTLFVALLALLILMVSPAGARSNALVVMLDRMGMVLVWTGWILAQLCVRVYALIVGQKESPQTVVGLPYPLWGIFPVITAMVAAIAIRVHLGLLEIQHPWLVQFSLFLFLGAPLAWVIVQLVKGRETVWAFNFWAGVLLISGAFVWVWFLNFGEGPFDFHDWEEVSLPRLIVMQNALRQGEFPLHIPVGPALLNLTDRFLGIPDLLLAPQVLLLKWIPVESFVITNLLLTYAAGFAGLVYFGHRYRLSTIPFTLLFLLFNLNGHIAAHIAVGHFIWATAYFLLPWLVALIFRLFEGAAGWKWVLQTAFLLFVLFLHGGYHYVVYALALLVLIAVLIPRYFGIAVRAVVFTVLLCAVRLLPLAFNAETFSQHIEYLDGFRSLWRIVESMMFVSIPQYAPGLSPLTEKVGSWELTYYMGFAGMIFFILFGIVAVTRNQTHPFRALLLPAFGLLLLSLDGVYQNLLAVLPVPPLTGERVAARFFLLAFLIILALAVIEFQHWYEKQKPSWLFHAGSAMIGLLLAHDLGQNLRLWQIKQTAQIFQAEAIDFTKLTITNHPDPAYVNALAAGAVISVITFTILSFLTWRERQRKNALSTGTPHDPTAPDPRHSTG